MHLSSREQWRLNARYIARSGAEAAAYLQELEQQRQQSSSSPRIIIPKLLESSPPSLASSSPFRAITLAGQGAKKVQGSAQVTVVSDTLSDTTEVSDILSDTLAGASPHAPDPPRRKRKVNQNSKGYKFSFRMPYLMKAKLEAKAAAAESYPSAYVSKLVADDLCLPIDQDKTARSRGVQEQIAALTVAINKQGALFNQIAAALNRGQPCPVSRQEIDDAWRRHMAVTNAIIKLGFD